MAATNWHDCTMAMGCTLGVFQATNLVLRHPHLFRELVAFSGHHDLTLKVEHFGDLLDGYSSDDPYFHTPTHFLSGVDAGWRLDRRREVDIVLVIGDADPFLDNNRALSRLLHGRGVHHQFHVWNGRAHRPGAWQKMAALYV